MRSMKSTTCGASFKDITKEPINEHLSVESESDDNETYATRFNKRRNS